MGLHVGCAEADITPPLGDVNGFGKVEEIDGRLRAKALCLGDGGSGATVLLGMADVGGFTRQEDRRMRRAMGKAAGVALGNVRLNASHNHSAPKTYLNVHDLLAPLGVPFVNPLWLDRVEAALAEAAREARSRMRAASARGGAARVARVAANRTYLLADGTAATRFGNGASPEAGAAPEGLVDPDAAVLQFVGENGRPAATLFNYACHATALAGRGRLVSPDFPGYASDIVEKETGGPAFFLQGACGSVGTGKYADGSLEQAKAMGERLAEATLEALAKADAVPCGPLAYAAWEEALPLDEGLPSPGEAAANLRRLAEAGEPGGRLWREAALMEVVSDPDAARRCELFVLGAGGWRLAGLPAESFVDSALALKALSPHPFTMVGAYYDCTLWYIPTRRAFREGGFEANGGWRYTAPGASEQLTSAAADRLGS